MDDSLPARLKSAKVMVYVFIPHGIVAHGISLNLMSGITSKLRPLLKHHPLRYPPGVIDAGCFANNLLLEQEKLNMSFKSSHGSWSIL